MHTPRSAGRRHDHHPANHPARHTRICWSGLLFAFLALAGFASSSFAQSLTPGGTVDFGAVPLGTSAAPQNLSYSVRINNTVNVGQVFAVTEGATGKDFVVTTQNCSGTLVGPAACQITVSFTPSAVGLRYGELFIEDPSGTVMNRAPLHGAGLGPQMVVSPATAVAITAVTGVSPTSIQPSSTVYDGNNTLFIDDALNARVLQSSTLPAATVAATIPASLATAPFSSVAIANDGTLYISSPNTATIYALPPGGVAAPLVLSGVTLVQPSGIAVDGWGYLYIADAGANDIVRYDLEGATPTTVLTLTGLGTPLAGPAALAVDPSDNLYVADSGNNRIVEVNLRTNAASVVSLSGLSLSKPEAVVVNAAGGLTIADTGNKRLVELPLSGGPYAITLIGATLNTPAGLTLLPTGDLLVSDTVAGLVQVTRSTSSLTFTTPTLVGSIDTADGDLALDVENTGSYALTVAGSGFPSISNNAFFADNAGTCPNTTTGTNGTQISVGQACTLEIGFKPTIFGTNTGTLNVSASGNGNVSATVNLTGTGYHVLSYFTVSVAPSTVTPGEPTTLTITAYNNDNTVDTTYTGTVKITCTDPACVLPTGSYTFTSADNGVHVFASTLTPPLNFNTLGTWTVTVNDTTFTSGQTYTGTSNIVTVVTTPAVSLTSSVNPVNVGANTTLTATVTSPYGTPTGTVTFMDGSTVLGTGTLNSSGVATLTVSFSTAGQHPLTVSYPGVGFFQAASSAILVENVQTLGTTLGLTSSVNPINVGANTVLTATATSTSGTPNGTITFLDGTTVLGSAPLNASGVATLTVSFSTPGTHPLTATYPATGAYQAATSNLVNENVQNFSATATLTSSVNPVLITNSTLLTATITSSAGTPSGTVTFYDGTASLGTVTLNSSGVATLNVTFSTNGQHILIVTYSGNGPYQPATSPKLTQIVEDFSLALATGSANSATVILGASTQFNLIVAPIGATTLAAPVVLSVTGLPSGATASFAPSTAAAGSGTTPVVMTINAPPITSSLRLPENPAHPSSRAPIFAAVLLLPAAFLLRRRRAFLKLPAKLLVLFLGLAVATGLSGCLSDQSTGYYGQTPETYTLTVTGTSGTLTHNVQVTLTVD